MFLNRIKIENFRQLLDVTLYLEDSTTVLAGPNNSGKTTATMILKNIFNDTTFKLNIEDLPAVQRNKWANTINKKMIEGRSLGVKDQDISMEIIDFMFNNDKGNLIPQFKVKFKVTYNVEDDIRSFSDYIMDLDEDKYEFHFIYFSEINRRRFEKIFYERYNKIKNKANSDVAMDMLLKIYVESLDHKCCFCDSSYSNTSEMEMSTFKNLFNFQCISAARALPEYGQGDAKGLTKALIELASDSDEWNEKLSALPNDILDPIEKAKVKEYVQAVSSDVLNTAMKEISKTNGNHTGELMLNLDIDEDDMKSLINRILQAMYLKDGILLNESSQGLGYSNLIYMHIILQRYIKSYNPYKVNFFLIEEPESHMHPQMQVVFAKYLFKQYDSKNIQGLITTHSNDIVRCSSMSKLRVIRSESIFKSVIYNLNIFKKELKAKPSIFEDTEILENFYDWFFEVGFSELIFSDGVIFYEGDTERLYLRKIITDDMYKELQEKYISFIQVGGAYAYNYKPLIEFLKIKSLIITDIDYNKDISDIDEIKQSISSNSTINNFYKNSIYGPVEKEIKLDKLYNWINDCNIVLWSSDGVNKKELVYLAFQTDKDNYTRTLESAMLSKKFEIDAVTKLKRSEWLEKKTKTKLDFTIPNNRKVEKENGNTEIETDSSFNLQDILKSTSNKKTDFMYSVIINELGMEMLPEYIKGGLKWLMK